MSSLQTLNCLRVEISVDSLRMEIKRIAEQDCEDPLEASFCAGVQATLDWLVDGGEAPSHIMAKVPPQCP